MRQTDRAWEGRDYLKTHPRAAAVNLGCSLDDTGRACDLNDVSWFKKIDASGGAVYLPRECFTISSPLRRGRWCAKWRKPSPAGGWRSAGQGSPRLS